MMNSFHVPSSEYQEIEMIEVELQRLGYTLYKDYRTPQTPDPVGIEVFSDGEYSIVVGKGNPFDDEIVLLHQLKKFTKEDVT